MKKSYSIFLSTLFCFLFCSLSAQDAQLYLLPDMEKRLRKRLSKSRNVKDYTEAVNLLFSSLEGKN